MVDLSCRKERILFAKDICFVWNGEGIIESALGWAHILLHTYCGSLKSKLFWSSKVFDKNHILQKDKLMSFFFLWHDKLMSCLVD